MSRLIVGPFNRVEGDLEVALEVVRGRVRSAQVNATMYRGFEQILQGKPAPDALIYVPRICGICSVSQSVAAARALADLAGLREMPANGQNAINLIAATENMADHLTHFYAFFMPDFCRMVYADRPWYGEALRRFSTDTGVSIRQAIAARQRWMMMLGTLAGKWPHTQSIEPGGSSRAIDAAERVRLLSRLREFRTFLENHLLGSPLEVFNSLQSEEALWSWVAQDPTQGDVRFFMSLVHDAQLMNLGPGPGRYLSYGAYPQPDGGLALARGVWRDAPLGQPGQLEALDTATITEDATHAWLVGGTAPLHPAVGLTQPLLDKAGGLYLEQSPPTRRSSGRNRCDCTAARQRQSIGARCGDAAWRGGVQPCVGAIGRARPRGRGDGALAPQHHTGSSVFYTRSFAQGRPRGGLERSGTRQPGALGVGPKWTHCELPNCGADGLEFFAT